MVRYLGFALLLALATGCTDSNFTEEQEFASGSAIADRGIPQLTSAQISVFLKDSTLVHESGDRRWHVYLRPDGTMAGHAELIKNPGTTETANGSWEVLPDDRICRQWQGDWGDGDFGCATVHREGEVYVFTPVDEAGERAASVIRRTRVAGNPLSL